MQAVMEDLSLHSWQAELEAPLVYPNATVPGGATQLPNTASVAGGSTGNPKIYKTTNFPLVKSTTFTGPVIIYVTGSISLPEGAEMIMPGDNVDMTVELITPIALEVGQRFAIREGGRTVGAGAITTITE